MGGSKLKQEIIEHLAARARVSQDQAEIVLDSLVRLACQEARNGFVIPGLCKIEVVVRKARKARNPRTGAVINVPAREVLKIRPLKRAQDMVVRTLPTLEEPAEEAVPAPAPAPPVPAPAIPDELAEPTQVIPSEPSYVTFPCTGCRREIEAPSEMAGMPTACPACGAVLNVPSESVAAQPEPIKYIQVPEAAPTIAEGGRAAYQKGSTIRIEVPEGLKLQRPAKRTIFIKRRG